MINKLHFVYNVEAKPTALVKDFIHRVVDPATYPCPLCDLTYGRFVKKPGWQRFLRSLPVQSRFYTKDRFLKKFPHTTHREFPAVLAEGADAKLALFISADEFTAIRSLAALQLAVTNRLKQY